MATTTTKDRDNKANENMITVRIHIDQAQSMIDVVAKMVGLLIVYPDMRKQVYVMPAIRACMEIIKADKSGRLRKRMQYESERSVDAIVKLIEEM